MIKEQFTIEQIQCTVYRDDDPAALLIQPVDDYDSERLDSEVNAITERTSVPFVLVRFKVNDWNDDLSPWSHPAVFGNKEFAGQAENTLGIIKDKLLPGIIKEYGLEDVPVIIGGYSLAALFALWCGYEDENFGGVAAASPSLWFTGWIDYVNERQPKATHIYLSLGDREEKTRNPIMSTVGDCIRKQHDIIKEDNIDCILEWNQGNHFRDGDIRSRKGFVWCLERIAISRGCNRKPWIRGYKQ